LNSVSRLTAFYVDFNSREVLADGNQAVAIRVGRANPKTLGGGLRSGLRVVVYDEGDSWEGIVREGQQLDGWVADLVPGTNRTLSVSDFEELERLRQVASDSERKGDRPL